MESSILSKVLRDELNGATKLTNLEERAFKLEREFSSMCSMLKTLENATRTCVRNSETERKSWDLMENIMTSDNNARDILDHVKIFFNFLLANMKSRAADVTDIKMLWHLLESEGIRQTFLESLKYFGFKETHFEDIKVLLAVVYKLHVNMEKDATDLNGETETVNRSSSAINASQDGESNEYLIPMNKELLNKIDCVLKEKAQISLTNKGSKVKQANEDSHDTVEREESKETESEKDVLETETDKDLIESINEDKVKQAETDKELSSKEKENIDKYIEKGLMGWRCGRSMHLVIKRMVLFVLFTLNVGRNVTDTFLSILD